MPALKTFKDSKIVKSTNKGYGTIQLLKINDKYFPYSIKVDKTSGIHFDEDSATITFKYADEKTIALTKDGFLSDKIITPYSDSTIEEFCRNLNNNQILQKSVLDISKALWALPSFHMTNDKDSSFDKEVAQQYKKFATNQSQSHKVGDNGDKSQKCEWKTVTESVTKTITTWVDQITTATDQAKECNNRCDTRYPGLDIRRAGCYIICATQSFRDIITGTIKVLQEIVEVVTTRVYICTPDPVKIFYHPFQLVDLNKVKFPGNINEVLNTSGGIKAGDVVGKVGPAALSSIKCLMKGTWSVTQLKHLNIDVPLIGEAPFGLKVCIGKECALKLKDSLLADTAWLPIELLKLLLTEGEAEKFFEELGVSDEMQGIITIAVNAGVVSAGMTVAALAKLILATILLTFYHAALIVGQISFYDANEALNKGVCLHHPTVPLVLAAWASVGTVVLIPPAFGALIHFPVIVTSR